MNPEYKLCQKYMKENKTLKMDRLKSKASRMYKEGKYGEAIDIFYSCLKIDPNNNLYNSQISFNLGMSYEKEGI